MFIKNLRVIMRFEVSMDGYCVDNDSLSRNGHCY